MSSWLDLFFPIGPICVIGRRMPILCNVLLVAIPLCNLIVWGSLGTHVFTVISNILVEIGYQPLEIFTVGGVVNPADITWTLASKSAMVLFKMIKLLPIIMGFYVLKLIFENYKKGDIFITQNGQYYRWIGVLLFWDSILVRPLCNAFFSLVVKLSHHSAHVITAGSHGYGAVNIIKLGFSLTELLIAALVLVISQVMLEGSCLHEENQFTI